MKHVVALVVTLAVAGMAGVTLAAHEITFKGTVVSFEPGKVPRIKVNVVDLKTKKTTAVVFECDDKTKFLRGDVVVKMDAARIEKGEQISITVDHDESETLANVVRLPVKK